MAKITHKGNPIHTNGDLPKTGTQAPNFKLVDGNLKDLTLADFKGKKKLLNIVPSLDTGICAKSTRHFDGQVPSLKNTAVLVISADLPFAQSRFCSAEHTDKVKTLSMMRDRHFAKDYGVLIEDGLLAGITARAVVVLDENDKVLYTELVSEIGQEPDYAKAVAALK
jgi:thiol peroxidase